MCPSALAFLLIPIYIYDTYIYIHLFLTCKLSNLTLTSCHCKLPSVLIVFNLESGDVEDTMELFS